MNTARNIFKAYDIRGIYPQEINAETAYRLGWSYSQYLKNDLKESLPFSVAIGMDMRKSSPLLVKELIHAFNDQGIDVVELGQVSTPAFYYAVSFKGFLAGIMVTASHNPKEFNGFKLCGKHASPVGLDSGLQKIKEYFESFDEENLQKASPRGKSEFLENINREYVERELSYLDTSKIKKLKIVADTAGAMGALPLDELFKKVDCEPIRINWQLDSEMSAHEANPIKLETLKELQAVIKKEKADFGIATDGDADRIVFLDEKAQVIPPYIVLGLIAQELFKKYPEEKIGYDLRSGKIVKEMIEESGGIAVETRVGHSFIKKLMKEENILFAGELSSHYYFRQNFNAESPIFVAGVLMQIRSERGLPFSEIWKSYDKYFHSGEINFEVLAKQEMMDKLEKKYSDGEISKLDGLKIEFKDWWFSIRPSNTEPHLRLNLEAETESQMKERLEELENILLKR